MEQEFRLLLQRLQPKPEYLRLFTQIVLDVWRNKEADVLLQKAAIEKRLHELKERKDQLIEAFVYKGVIDKPIFQEQLDKLNEEKTLAEIHLNEISLDEPDVESALNFAQYVLLDAGRLWVEATSDQKQRIQQAIFPGGVSFSGESFRTAKTALAFSLLESPVPQEETVVSPTGSDGFSPLPRQNNGSGCHSAGML